ncbi:MAG: SUF system NifU family Fe-S cluster assembly protein [Bacilli bacterium]
MDNNLRREIILENYNNPKNRGLVKDKTYKFVNTNNSSCIDNIDIMVKIEENKIKDIVFDGEACAITTSATSIMIKSLLDKSIKEVKDIIINYEKMINEEEYDDKILGELNVYDEVYKQPNRKKCALLPIEAIKKVINM